jgi:dipeptidyl aminopeptidase/acylaminoacyl peptidase
MLDPASWLYGDAQPKDTEEFLGHPTDQSLSTPGNRGKFTRPSSALYLAYSCCMEFSVRFFVGIMLAASTLYAQQPKPFTLQQVLSAPYASELVAAPAGNLFAWVESAEGRRNLWIGGANTPARQLTHNTQDDGLEITGLTWSPDATAIAYCYGTEAGADGKPANPAHLQRSTQREVIVQPLAANAKSIDLGEGHAPLFARDSKSLFFVRAGQVWTSDLMAALGKQVLRDTQDDRFITVRQLVIDRGQASKLTLSPDGKLLAFVSTRKEAKEPDHSFIGLFDLNARTLRFLGPSPGIDTAPTFSPDSKQLAWLRAPFTQAPEYTPERTSPNPWSIQLFDLTENCPPKRREESASPACSRTVFTAEANTPGSVLPHMATGEPLLFFARSGRILYLSEADGYLHLYSVSAQLPQRKPIQMTKGNFELEDISFDVENSQLYCSSNLNVYDPKDSDRRHICSYLLGNADTEELGMSQLTSGAGIEAHPVAATNQLAALVSDAQTPMHPALIEPPLGASPGSITPLHPGAFPKDYPAQDLLTPLQVIFSAGDSMQIHGQIFLSKKLDPKSKHPAIVFLHGGPNRQMLLGYPAMEYYSNAYAMNQYLASRGFIVLSVNYRSGIGYGMDFREAEDAGPNGAAEYNDVLAAAKYLQNRADVDAKRIGLWGGSYGGYLTELALARNSDIFAAGVSLSGIYDWNLEDNASDWKKGSNATQDALAVKARASSPIGSIDMWKSPVLLIHGDNDPDVAYAQTLTAANALTAHHVPFEELIFPDETHDFLLHRTWLAAYKAAAAFFERNLMPATALANSSPMP